MQELTRRPLPLFLFALASASPLALFAFGLWLGGAWVLTGLLYMTALALALGYGADRVRAVEALRGFAPGGHRIQTVAVAGRGETAIRFVDDSKATNAHAARASSWVR